MGVAILLLATYVAAWQPIPPGGRRIAAPAGAASRILLPNDGKQLLRASSPSMMPIGVPKVRDSLFPCGKFTHVVAVA